MASTSNERIMSEHLVKWALVKSSDRERPTELLEALYIAERFQALPLTTGARCISLIE